MGFWLGFEKLSGDVLEPMFVTVYAIPKLTLYPILLLAFGLGLSAKVAFGVLHGVIPIILFTLSAVRNTKPILLKTGHVLKLSRPQMVRWILFPAAIPEIFTGLRVGFSLTLIGCILAEMFASQRGLGYLLMTGIGLHNVAQVMSVTLLDRRLRRCGEHPAASDRSAIAPTQLIRASNGSRQVSPGRCSRRGRSASIA